ncbi:hypothetical protein KC332_g10602 [Hortaea werneckii]|nr:hypothetical protein KC350_g9764 [Hortaea werneckii]KAI6977768.1 hypothetical protein KC329_g10668 [Hortaea werneckii]KAI7028739.1 hypothetical protein KC366_g11007 [Hortaea werneckii]KAI7067290.1 hypothetical protein KC327_g10381 [Hortaea werneckii]KAI7125038.1 hypothetical protein KC337_g10830 [Hortaea werneckii]
MSTPTFQSRIEFLSKGLAPVTATTLAGLVAEDRDCAICTEELTDEDAVQLPSRAQLVIRAARTAGLPLRQPTQLNFFGIRTFSESAMARALTAATQYLVFSPEPERFQRTGPATLDWINLQEHFITMGNLLPSLGAHQDRPYSQQQQDIWVAILIRLWAILARSDGEHYDAMTLPLELRSRLRLSLTHSNVNVKADVLAFFDDGSDFGRDLNTMLSFLAHISFQFRRQQQALEQAAAQEAKLSLHNDLVAQCWDYSNARDAHRRTDASPPAPNPTCHLAASGRLIKMSQVTTAALVRATFGGALALAIPNGPHQIYWNPANANKSRAHLSILPRNAIPALAKAEGRAYTQAQQKKWQAIVSSVWAALNSFNGTPRPSYDLPDDLHKLAVQYLTEREGELTNVPFFSPADNEYTLDLELLLNFVAYVSAALYAEHQEVKEKVREEQIKRGGKLLNPCGNELMKEAERQEAMDKLCGYARHR